MKRTVTLLALILGVLITMTWGTEQAGVFLPLARGLRPGDSKPAHSPTLSVDAVLGF